MQWKLHLQFAFFSFGVYASRINTALIGVTMLIQNVRTRCFVLKLRPLIAGIGFGLPVILVIIMSFVMDAENENVYDIGHTNVQKIDPNFQFGRMQNYVSVALLSISFATTVISLVLNQRWRRRLGSLVENSPSDDPTRYLLEDGNEIDDVNDLNTNDEAIIGEVFDDDNVGRSNATDIEDLIETAAPVNSNNRQRYGSNNGCSESCRERVGAGRYRCDSEVCIRKN